MCAIKVGELEIASVSQFKTKGTKVKVSDFLKHSSKLLRCLYTFWQSKLYNLAARQFKLQQRIKGNRGKRNC